VCAASTIAKEAKKRVDLDRFLLLSFLVLVVSVTVTCKVKKNTQIVCFVSFFRYV